MKDQRNKIIAILSIAVLAMLYLLKTGDDDKRNKELEYQQKILGLEQQLSESKQFRDSLTHRFNRLNSDHEILLVEDSLKTEKLKLIPGTFNKKNSKELSEEMIRIFQTRKR